jgi:hypothetical protein
VAEQNRVDRRQLLEAQRGWTNPFGPQQSEGAGARAEDRIGQHREARQLQKVRGMADERRGNMVFVHLSGQVGFGDRRPGSRPRFVRTDQTLQPPLGQVGKRPQPHSARIEKMRAVAVVGDGVTGAHLGMESADVISGGCGQIAQEMRGLLR